MKELESFITLKNEGIEYVVGNELKNTPSNFQFAEGRLHQAESKFKHAASRFDVVTMRILDYIHENPYPLDTFEDKGISIDEKQGNGIGTRLLLFSEQLIKTFDYSFYHALVENTDLEGLFTIQWFNTGETIMQVGDEPNGIYYLALGKVRVEDGNGTVITELSEGDIFSEMAYFSPDRRRSANVTAVTDTAIRRISSEDFEKTSILHKLFAELVLRRLSPV